MGSSIMLSRYIDCYIITIATYIFITAAMTTRLFSLFIIKVARLRLMIATYSAAIGFCYSWFRLADNLWLILVSDSLSINPSLTLTLTLPPTLKKGCIVAKVDSPDHAVAG